MTLYHLALTIPQFGVENYVAMVTATKEHCVLMSMPSDYDHREHCKMYNYKVLMKHCSSSGTIYRKYLNENPSEETIVGAWQKLMLFLLVDILSNMSYPIAMCYISHIALVTVQYE